jgi:tetratricopeptide (TPR) repeat protein
MAEFRYKAFMSYSHMDEAIAEWLHRGLESYRVPRNLVGKLKGDGEVPSRIRPVFRDRDDLSSSSDLKDTVKQALSDSENLIVLCSPEAAASHWVNEEIRQFAALGRADRIYCIIVGGVAKEDGLLSALFPPALAEIGIREPLAADARSWSDGKYIAKLKLIAGMLGIRLDELRQRDMQRRRKRQLLAGLAIVTALVLATMTVISQISRQHERDKAEQLATFIVDLGERLKSDVDLETLAIISAESFKHLQGLDPDKLSPETGKKVALSLRQMGRISQLQGRPDEAFEPFKRSYDLLSSLHDKYPQRQDMLFELGNAAYYIGNLHYDQGRHEEAVESMQTYYRLAQSLLDTDPENPDWIMELSYAHNNLAALQLGSGKGINQETLFHVAEATRLKKQMMSLRPGDEAVADSYSTTLAWAADAQFQACNLEESRELRIRARELAESTMLAEPGNNDLKRRYAYSITGVVRIQVALGQLGLVEEDLRLAISILQQLSAADPSNITYREEMLYRRVMLAKLLSDIGQIESATILMKELKTEFELTGEYENKGIRKQKEYIELLLAYADTETQLGHKESANDLLQTVFQESSKESGIQTGDLFDIQRLVKARYLWWWLNRENSPEDFPALPGFEKADTGEFRSCIEADSAARVYVMEDKQEAAASEIAYLKARGYAEPSFIRFCKGAGFCEG